MQQITPITMGIVGGVLISLGAFVIYVENRLKGTEEDIEKKIIENGTVSRYNADKGFAPTLEPIKEGGKTKRARKTKRTKRK
jgi:hypothetical protein